MPTTKKKKGPKKSATTTTAAATAASSSSLKKSEFARTSQTIATILSIILSIIPTLSVLFYAIHLFQGGGGVENEWIFSLPYLEKHAWFKWFVISIPALTAFTIFWQIQAMATVNRLECREMKFDQKMY